MLVGAEKFKRSFLATEALLYFFDLDEIVFALCHDIGAALLCTAKVHPFGVVLLVAIWTGECKFVLFQHCYLRRRC